MNKLTKILMTVLFLTGIAMPAFASDWDVAGKVLTGLEGLRVISGGQVDIIGTITGINNRGYDNRHGYRRYREADVDRDYYQREWVPDYIWEDRWVPGHSEYDPYRGCMIFVEGHYVRYKVESGGHWVYYNYPHRGYGYNACGR